MVKDGQRCFDVRQAAVKLLNKNTARDSALQVCRRSSVRGPGHGRADVKLFWQFTRTSSIRGETYFCLKTVCTDMIFVALCYKLKTHISVHLT